MKIKIGLLLLFICCLQRTGNAQQQLTRYMIANEYCDFLNDRAVADSRDFYDNEMSLGLADASILRVGEPGDYHYEVTGEKENVPIYFISYPNALAYCDWLTKKLHRSCTLSSTSIDELLKCNQRAFFIEEENILLSSNNNLQSTFSNLSTKAIIGIITCVVVGAGGYYASSRSNNLELTKGTSSLRFMRVADIALQDENLKSDIRVGRNSVTIAGNMNLGCMPSKQETLENLKKNVSSFFDVKKTELIKDGELENKLNVITALSNEAQSDLTTVTHNLEKKFNDPAISTSQAIQEAARDAIQSFYFLRKKYLVPQLEPQIIPLSEEKSCTITPAPSAKTLILAGGGVKGVGYIGAYKAMQQSGVLKDVSLIGGSSAGAIMGAFIAAGMDATLLEQTCSNMNYLNFITKDAKDPSEDDRYTATSEGGLSNGHYAEDFIGKSINNSLAAYFNSHSADVIQQKISQSQLNDVDRSQLLKIQSDAKEGNLKPLTFKELALLHQLDPSRFRNLVVTGYDKTKPIKEAEQYYHATTHPDLSIAQAVRISMSLPIAFTAVENAQGDFLIDGGTGSNIPTEIVTKIIKEVGRDLTSCLVCSFNDDGEFYRIVHSQQKTSFFLWRWFQQASNSIEIGIEDRICGNVDLAKTARHDAKKLYQAGPKALNIYHGTISMADFEAPIEDVSAAILQAETHMWGQLILRQNQAVCE